MKAKAKRSDTMTGSPVKRDNRYNIVTASPPTQTNSESIHEDGTDFSYFASIDFGSSGKSMYMLVDTGAANTWAMGSDCKSRVCAEHETFGPSDSTSLKVSADDFALAYGTGAVSGLTATDTVTIAGISLSLPFGLASDVSDDFSTYPMDGILGLGPPSSKAMDFPTAMETIQKANALSANLFGVNLQRASDGSIDGELSFGAPDETKFQGDLSYTSLVPGASMWEIPIDDAKVGGSPCNFAGRTALIDTGTSFMLLPPSDAKQIHKQIPGSEDDGEIFNIPCASQTPVQLIFSGKPYNISPADYVGAPTKKHGSTCTSNIIGRRPFGPDQWLVGDVFLKNVYTVFDYDEERIGFAAKASGPLATPTPLAQSTSSAASAASSNGRTGTPTPTASVDKPVVETASPSTLASQRNGSPTSTAVSFGSQLEQVGLVLLCLVISMS